MDRIRIQGPCRLAGRVRISGAKNAILPEMAACLMLDGPATLRNAPAVRDVATMAQVLRHLGMRGVTHEDGVLRVEASEPGEPEAPYDLVRTMRASFVVLGPLLARLGRARVSLPGGCAIGPRPVDRHLKGLAALGAGITVSGGYVEARAERLRGAEIVFEDVRVGATLHVMMAATLAEGRTVLVNAAREPEAADMGALLNAMGARVTGAGTDRIVIDGVKALHGAEHANLPDRIEAGTFLVLSLLT